MARTELDPDHITAVCDRLTRTRAAANLNITPTLRGYAIDASSDAAARRVQAAFTRLGYQANIPERFGRRDKVTITGWSQRGLELRVAALYNSVIWLQNSRDHTAATAIDNGIRSRGDLHDSLRTTIERTTGVITDRPVAVRPEDRDCARLLQTANQLEHEAAHHIGLHVQAAETAVDLYRQYQPGMREDQARTYAITTACAQGPPPGWASPPHLTNPPTQSPDGPDHAPAATETPDTHPVAIAAHDQPTQTHPGEARIETGPDEPPQAPAVSNRPGPARGPATR